jgi:hypothetical protein
MVAWSCALRPEAQGGSVRGSREASSRIYSTDRRHRAIRTWPAPRRGTSEEWQRANTLLDAALDLPPGERAALLEEACGDDPGLRPRVEPIRTLDAIHLATAELLGDAPRS